MKIKIVDSWHVESKLYEVMLEDGPGTSFDCLVEAKGEDGRIYQHKKYFFGNTEIDEYGIPYLKRSKIPAMELAKKVKAKGEINLKHWIEISGNI
jgi:hypothetical protein